MYSEPPVHKLCRRLGFAYREYRKAVAPGDALLKVMVRILEEGARERLRRRPPQSFFTLLGLLRRMATGDNAEL